MTSYSVPIMESQTPNAPPVFWMVRDRLGIYLGAYSERANSDEWIEDHVSASTHDGNIQLWVRPPGEKPVVWNLYSPLAADGNWAAWFDASHGVRWVDQTSIDLAAANPKLAGLTVPISGEQAAAQRIDWYGLDAAYDAAPVNPDDIAAIDDYVKAALNPNDRVPVYRIRIEHVFGIGEEATGDYHREIHVAQDTPLQAVINAALVLTVKPND